MTSLLLLLCAAHAFVPSPPTRQPRRRRATQTHAIRNWWSGASSDRDWRAAVREACAGVAAVLGEADDDDAVLALCFASRGHAQSIGSIGEAFDEEVGDRATSVALIGGGVVGGAGDEREDGATNEQRQTDNSEAAPSLSVLVGVLPKGSSIEAASFAPDKTPPPKKKAERWQGPARRRAAGMSRLCRPIIAVAGAELRRARRALPRLCGGRRPHLRRRGRLNDNARRRAAPRGRDVRPGAERAPAPRRLRRVAGLRARGRRPRGDAHGAEPGRRRDRWKAAGRHAGRGDARRDGPRARAAEAGRARRFKAIGGVAVVGRWLVQGRRRGGRADWLVRQIIGQVPSVREQMSWSNRMSGIQYGP